MTVQTIVPIHPRVQAFLESPRKLLINNEWVEAASGETFETYDPSNGKVLARCARGGLEDVDRAVRAARAPLRARGARSRPLSAPSCCGGSPI